MARQGSRWLMVLTKRVTAPPWRSAMDGRLPATHLASIHSAGERHLDRGLRFDEERKMKSGVDIYRGRTNVKAALL